MVGSTAPAPFWDAPLRVWKFPPSTTWEPSGAAARAYTTLLTAGAHGVIAPAEVTAPT